jgi:hypothetical protein
VPYVVTPGCTGPNGEALCLAAMDDGSICVQDASEVTESMLWSLVFDVPTGKFAMINVGSVASGAPRWLSIISSHGNINKLGLTRTAGGTSEATLWDVVAGGSALAVQSARTPAINLNVSGSGPYPPGSPVIAYNGWGGGTPNEIWTFTAFGGEDYPWNYAFSPTCAPNTVLTANPQDAGGQLTIDEPSGGDGEPGPEQLWGANYVILNGIHPLGVVFINEELSMAIRSTPGGGAIFCADPSTLDAWSAWRVGGAPDVGAWALHAIGNDNLTWNVSGAGPYDPGNVVISYPWQGGADNEQWNVTFVPHEVT